MNFSTKIYPMGMIKVSLLCMKHVEQGNIIDHFLEEFIKFENYLRVYTRHMIFFTRTPFGGPIKNI